MARSAFVENKVDVAKVLSKMEGKTVRLLEAPASYYLMRQMQDRGLVKNAKFGKAANGRTIKGFALTPKGQRVARAIKAASISSASTN